MQHLFGNTYLSVDSSFEQNAPCAILSSISANLPSDEWFAVHTADLGAVVWHGSNLEQFDASSVFQQLLDHPSRTYVYVEPTAYPAFLAKWVKTIFPHVGDYAGQFLKMSLAHSRYGFGYPFAQRRRIQPHTAKAYCMLHDSCDIDYLQGLYDLSPAFDLPEELTSRIKDSLGVEVAVAEYLLEKSQWAGERIVNVAQRALLDVTMDCVRYVIEHPTLIPDFNPATHTIEEWAEEHPEHSIIADVRLKSGGDLSYALETYGEQTLASVARDVALWSGNTNAHIFKVLTPDEVMEKELSTLRHSPMLAAGRRDSLINTFLLNRLYVEARAGKVEIASRLRRF